MDIHSQIVNITICVVCVIIIIGICAVNQQIQIKTNVCVLEHRIKLYEVSVFKFLHSLSLNFVCLQLGFEPASSYKAIRHVTHSSVCFMMSSLCRDTVMKATNHIDICLKQRQQARLMAGGMQDGALLLCGIHGVGKTALANALCREAMSAPNYAFVQKVDCKSLRGRNIGIFGIFILKYANG